VGLFSPTENETPINGTAAAANAGLQGYVCASAVRSTFNDTANDLSASGGERTEEPTIR